MYSMSIKRNDEARSRVGKISILWDRLKTSNCSIYFRRYLKLLCCFYFVLLLLIGWKSFWLSYSIELKNSMRLNSWKCVCVLLMLMVVKNVTQIEVWPDGSRALLSHFVFLQLMMKGHFQKMEVFGKKWWKRAEEEKSRINY